MCAPGCKSPVCASNGGRIVNFQNVEFLISAASKENFPTKRLPEIAFAGKSNVIFVNNVVNTAEVKEKLKAYLGI